jgi:hypothetical protein
METAQLMKLIEEAFPNRLPLNHTTEYALGELIGQQQVVNYIKSRLNFEGDKNVIDK